MNWIEANLEKVEMCSCKKQAVCLYQLLIFNSSDDRFSAITKFLENQYSSGVLIHFTSFCENTDTVISLDATNLRWQQRIIWSPLFALATNFKIKNEINVN